MTTLEIRLKEMDRMTDNTISEMPALKYPVSSTIRVYKNDGKWDNYSAWFLRSDRDLENLFVCGYGLPVDEDGDVDFSIFDWKSFSQKIINDHPGCLFIYS
jgi:hypothetical protein